MFFRRISQSIKDQNWMAILVDFAIVVIGVIIGLQVANWNDARLERAGETRILKKLYQDVVEAQKFVDGTRDRRPILIADMASAYDKIFDRSEAPLTDAECWAVFGSSVASYRMPLLPTLGALQANPGRGQFDDERLSSAISSYSQHLKQVDIFVDASFRDAVEIGQAFPDLISLQNYVDEDGNIRISSVCDLEAMQANQTFKNAFAVNRDKQDSLALRSVPVSQAFSDIRTNLERVLEID